MKKLPAFLLLLALALNLAACGVDTESAETDADTITVVDMAGCEVAIPADTAHNTVATTYGVLTPFFVTLHISDRVLATTIKNKAFMRKVDEDIINAGDIGNQQIDAEALANYAPDVLMLRTGSASGGDDKKAVADRLGIPTVMVSLETPDEVLAAYELVGRMFDREERAAELTGWIENEMAEIQALAATVPAEEKKTALCMGCKLGQVAGENMLQTMMIKMAGGLCEVTEIADNLKWVEAGVETVFAKDPEVIFVTSSYPADYTLEQLYEDPAWSSMQAVRERQIFNIPAKMDSWDMPGPAFVLGAYYMMHCMYPQLVSTEMMQQKTDEYYQFFYGRTFSGEERNYSF